MVSQEFTFLERLVLFFIEHDEDMEDWLDPDKRDSFLPTLNDLKRRGFLEVDFSKDCMLRVSIKSDEELDVSKFRSYFLKGYSGHVGYASTNEVVGKLLKEYRTKYPQHTPKMIMDAAKVYVDHCRVSGEWMMKATNFIDKDGDSKLAAVVDDGVDSTEEFYDVI